MTTKSNSCEKLPDNFCQMSDLSHRLISALERRGVGVWDFRAEDGSMYLSSEALRIIDEEPEGGDGSGAIYYGADPESHTVIPLERFIERLHAFEACSFRFALAEAILDEKQLEICVTMNGKQVQIEGLPFKDENNRQRLTGFVSVAGLAVARRSDEPVTLQGMTVVAVDDNEDSRLLVQAILEGYGARVLLAGSAEEGFDLIETELPQLIVSDLSMPDEDGFSFLRRVRALAPSRGGCIPAVAVTGFDEDDSGELAAESGFQAYVTKPIDPDELIGLASRLLEIA